MKKQLLLGVASLATVFNLFAQNPVPQVLFEDFSGSEGLPEGWEVVNSTPEMATLQGGHFTWQMAESPDDFPAPLSGDKIALIYQASYTDDAGRRVELSQDEWLISPTISLGTESSLSFGLSYIPMFLYNCSNEYLDFSSDPLDFKERVPATTLKVMVKAEGDADWTEVYDVFDLWQGYTLDDLMTNYFARGFRDNVVDLEAFSGKDVRIGFRFVGYMGNAMGLDAVKVLSMPGAGIDAVEADGFAGGERVDVFNAAGVRVGGYVAGEGAFDDSSLAPGFYILSGNGRTVKVAVK